jgi:uncharacterized protein YprB with RNaseH-like and TPR domain
MDDSLRTRLEALNRAPMPQSAVIVERMKQAVEVATNAATFRRPTTKHAVQPSTPAGATQSAGGAGLLRSGEVVETPFGQHARIELPLDQLWQGGTKLITARQEFLRHLASSAATAVEPTVVFEAEFMAFVAALPDRTIALDLETCGLAGSALFLIGVLRQTAGVPAVELLLARNYGEEAAVLHSLWQIVADHDVLLTFNGKSFDWPMVVERSIRHRLEVKPVGWSSPTQKRSSRTPNVDSPQAAKVHIDILHHARRRWKRQLPNCRLQTLERHICRRLREGDIPGHAIPAAYANYVRTGFEREMDAVLYHNALDLVTLFDLAHRLAA